MKAVVIHAARDLRVEEREVETPSAGQVEISVEAGGICGSDLHYFNHGGFGTVRVREPMILGHEVAGTVKTLGASVSGLAIGDRVAVSPSRPCNACDYCLKGQQNHCLNMRFYGSAMPMPHIQGAFRQRLVATSAERRRGRPLGEGRFEASHPSTFLIDADPERPVAGQRGDFARQLRDLPRFDGVAGEVDHATEIELGDERAEIVGHRVAAKADDGQAASVAPQFPNRH